MKTETPQNPPALRRPGEEDGLSLTGAYGLLTSLFSSHGYTLVDTPILEPAELFVRKGGGELAARMHSFTDPGGNWLSLRPEFTSSIVRSCLENNLLRSLPFRAQYGGPVFRYGGEREPRRQFHQAGVELIGSGHPRADAEALVLACQGLAALGIRGGVKLTLGDLGPYNELAGRLGLSERARLFVLDNVSRLKGGAQELEAAQQRAHEFRLISKDGLSDPVLAQPVLVQPVLAQIEGLDEGRARDLIAAMIEQTEPGFLGQRTAEEIAERLLNKLRGAQDREKMTRALRLASQLAAIEGEPAAALEQARGLLKAEAPRSEALDRLEEVVSLMDGEDLGGAEARVDFGMTRGIAYYTGVLFELVDVNSGLSLGGGGRYDDLIGALGGRDLPAFGFAYDVEHILAMTQDQPHLGDAAPQRSGVLALPATPDAFKEARRVAAELRDSRREPVEMEVSGRSLQECLAYAAAKGISEVIEVFPNSERKTHLLDVK